MESIPGSCSALIIDWRSRLPRTRLRKEMVRLLTETIRSIHTAKAIVVQPDAENAISRSVLIANGYVYDENGDVWLLGLERKGEAT